MPARSAMSKLSVPFARPAAVGMTSRAADQRRANHAFQSAGTGAADQSDTEDMQARKSAILVLASTYPRWAGDHEPGFVHELCCRLTSRFRVIALSPHARGSLERETLDGVEVVRYRYAPQALETLVSGGGIMTNLRRSKWKLLLVPFFLLAQMWAAWRVIRCERIGVVHAHWLIPQGLIAALLQCIPGGKVPFVVTSHGADLFALSGGLLAVVKRYVVRRASAVTVVSSAMQKPLQELGATPQQLSVMPMGVDLSRRFTPQDQSPRSDNEILFVGRLVEKKGLRHLIAAMPLVLQQVPDAELTIAGFGPEELALREQVREAGLSHKVRFVGAVSQADLPALYRRAAVFVAPFVRAGSGDEEGLGLVVAEAAGCQCPVVVGDVPAAHELLGPWPELRVDPRDPDALAGKIVGRLAGGASTVRAAQQLRLEVLDRLDWEQVAAGYAELLSGTIKSRC